jgi:Family of unknown function (DUF6328)
MTDDDKSDDGRKHNKADGGNRADDGQQNNGEQNIGEQNNGEQNDDDGQDDGKSEDESRRERLERNWDQLLQELRVTQTGVQLLTGFLLTLPFQQKFASLDTVQVTIYLVTVGCAAAATALIIAPVAFHRIVFRQHEKHWLVRAAHVLAFGGLSGLALAVVGVIWLIFDVVLGRTASTAAGAVTAAVFAVLWLAVPITLRREDVFEHLTG